MSNNLVLCDTHCHLHDIGYPYTVDEMLASSAAASVTKIVTLGSEYETCNKALDYVKKYNGASGVSLKACIGFYPQETAEFNADTIKWLQDRLNDNRASICGVGEIGLDYYYDTVTKGQQLTALEAQLQLAVDNDLPVSLHIRSGEYGDAFADFFPVIDNFGSLIRGVLHSFTGTMSELDQVLARDLMVGVNGIATFNRDAELNEVYRNIPLNRLVLETDAPFLSPVPYRGKVNQPCRIRQIAEYMAKLRGVSLATLAEMTTANATTVYDV